MKDPINTYCRSQIGLIVNIGRDENNYDGFDWTLGRPTAYGENQQSGPWTQADRDGYADFVSKLADSRHARLR